MKLRHLFCWHRWVKQQETVLFSIKAEHLTVGLVIACIVLFILTMMCSLPEQAGGPPAIDLGLGNKVIQISFGAALAYGAYILAVYHQSEQVPFRSISDRTCYKCDKTVMAVTDRNVAMKNAEARLRARRQTIQDVNNEVWKQ